MILQHVQKIIGLSIIGACMAVSIAAAYTTTTATPPNQNAYGPITVSSADQIKNGGLAVGTFNARGNALFAQDVVFKGLVHGGTVGNTNSKLKFGTNAQPTSITISGAFKTVGILQSDSLTGTAGSAVCASSMGILVRC